MGQNDTPIINPGRHKPSNRTTPAENGSTANNDAPDEVRNSIESEHLCGGIVYTLESVSELSLPHGPAAGGQQQRQNEGCAEAVDASRDG